jgi:hypothetical protein
LTKRAHDVITNTIENYFSMFKRGMRGVYQHCPRSTCTAISRSSISVTTTALPLGVDDAERAATLAGGIVGERLTYRRPYKA